MLKPTDRRLLAAGLASALLLAACSGGPSPTATPPPATAGPSATPAGSPASSPTAETGAIAHPTGATDLVLRFDEGGGLVMPTFAMIQLPFFSLYGDGTVIYRPASAPWPEQKAGEPLRFPPLQVATMTEDQVQALLRDALGQRGPGSRAGPLREQPGRGRPDGRLHGQRRRQAAPRQRLRAGDRDRRPRQPEPGRCRSSG